MCKIVPTNIPMSTEGADLLNRSNKKVKIGGLTLVGNQMKRYMRVLNRMKVLIWMSYFVGFRKMTYGDMVMGKASNSQTQPLDGNGIVEDGISDEEEDDGDENDSKCPTIKVSCERKKKLRRKWQRTLII